MTIQALIDDYLLKKQEERKSRERSGKWSPSSFGRCQRMQYWNRLNEPQSNPSDERSLRVMSAGNIFHQWVREIILKTEKSYEVEKKVETEDTLGFADIVTEEEVIDEKTEHSYAKDYRKVEGYSIIEDKKQNILQVGWYAINLRKKFFRLVFIDRDNLLIDEYKISVTDTIKEMVFTELKELNNYWLTGTLPQAKPRCYGVDKKTGLPNECQKYCSFKDKCKQLEESQGRKWGGDEKED